MTGCWGRSATVKWSTCLQLLRAEKSHLDIIHSLQYLQSSAWLLVVTALTSFYQPGSCLQTFTVVQIQASHCQCASTSKAWQASRCALCSHPCRLHPSTQMEVHTFTWFFCHKLLHLLDDVMPQNRRCKASTQELEHVLSLSNLRAKCRGMAQTLIQDQAEKIS